MGPATRSLNIPIIIYKVKRFNSCIVHVVWPLLVQLYYDKLAFTEKEQIGMVTVHIRVRLA
jgi:hypothetical protein